MKLFNWLTKQTEKTNEIIKTQQLTTKETLNDIISETIKPFLKDNGYGKKALTFYKKSDDLTFVINFQNSQGNSSDQTRFYINCGIYSSHIDKTIDKIELKEPKEYECHYRVRISQITNSKLDGYTIDTNTDSDKLKQSLKEDLKTTLRHFDSIKSITDLTDLMISYNCLDFTLFEYFILTSDLKNTEKQVKKIEEVWNSEVRWTRIKNDLNRILTQYNQQMTIDEILTKK